MPKAIVAYMRVVEAVNRMTARCLADVVAMEAS